LQKKKNGGGEESATGFGRGGWGGPPNQQKKKKFGGVRVVEKTVVLEPTGKVGGRAHIARENPLCVPGRNGVQGVPRGYPRVSKKRKRGGGAQTW